MVTIDLRRRISLAMHSCTFRDTRSVPVVGIYRAALHAESQTWSIESADREVATFALQ